ncbi:MAG: hypothetical protein OXP11_20790 [Gammaproteobacteria bacterium]|nr:hypothetical protein [Gammaproteobacteria bacterium]
MRLKERIYCIEGVWDWGDREVEPSVEPILHLLRGLDLWDYVRRDCATTDEFKHYVQGEWWKRCRPGSILYIASHGDKGSVSLSGDHFLDLGQVATFLEPIGCEGRLVHFGGCNVLNHKGKVVDFIKRTGASAVSGYGTEIAWTDQEFAPAVALELLFFSSISSQDISSTHVGMRRRLLTTAEGLGKRFPDCEFGLYIKGAHPSYRPEGRIWRKGKPI